MLRLLPLLIPAVLTASTLTPELIPVAGDGTVGSSDGEWGMSLALRSVDGTTFSIFAGYPGRFGGFGCGFGSLSCLLTGSFEFNGATLPLGQYVEVSLDGGMPPLVAWDNGGLPYLVVYRASDAGPVAVQEYFLGERVVMGAGGCNAFNSCVSSFSVVPVMPDPIVPVPEPQNTAALAIACLIMFVWRNPMISAAERSGGCTSGSAISRC